MPHKSRQEPNTRSEALRLADDGAPGEKRETVPEPSVPKDTEEKAGEAYPLLDPAVKFFYGHDVQAYLDRAVALLRESYPWVTEQQTDRRCRFAIEKENGRDEFIEYRRAGKGRESREVLRGYLEDMDSEQFIRHIAFCSESHVLRSNEVIDSYSVPFYPTEVGGGWYLEHYIFEKRATGDYTVNVQAGDRSAGSFRIFGISRKCFEQPDFSSFLDEYVKIVPGSSFGLFKEDLIGDGQLKAFLGFTPPRPHPEVDTVELETRKVLGLCTFCSGNKDTPIKTDAPCGEGDSGQKVELLWKELKERLGEAEHYAKKVGGNIPGFWGIMSSDDPNRDFAPWRRYYKSGDYFAVFETEKDSRIDLPSREWKETVIPGGKFIVCRTDGRNYDEVFMHYVNTVIPEMGLRLRGGVCEYIDASGGSLSLYFPVRELV